MIYDDSGILRSFFSSSLLSALFFFFDLVRLAVDIFSAFRDADFRK